MPGGDFSEDPGLWERFGCWAQEGGAWCQDARGERYARENAALQHQQDLADQARIAAEAQAGATDAMRQAMFNQAATAALIVVPPLLLVVGGIGGYLWWRRGKREDAALEVELAAATLEAAEL